MRTLVLALVLAACSDPDPHALGTCVNWTVHGGAPFEGMCEAACKSPPKATGKSCDTLVQLNCMSFVFEEIEGCCVQDPDMGPIRFHECQ